MLSFVLSVSGVLTLLGFAAERWLLRFATSCCLKNFCLHFCTLPLAWPVQGCLVSLLGLQLTHKFSPLTG